MRKSNMSLFNTLLANAMFASSNMGRQLTQTTFNPKAKISIQSVFGFNPENFEPSPPPRRNTRMSNARKLKNKRVRQARRMTRLRS